MSEFPGHLAISASAGTGKTFQLAHRFVRLIMLGEAPERIIALTFSRKAAREIFDRVIEYLADASSSKKQADKRNAILGMPHLTPDDYQKALRRLLEKLPRSRVGTIDSFMVGVVRSFPYELGLEPDFQILDNNSLEAQRCRRDALRLVMQAADSHEQERIQFFESFKYATFGHEEKSSTRILNDLMDEYQVLYRLQPDPDCWGLPDNPGHVIIPDRNEWKIAIESFRSAVADHGWPAKVYDYWMEFCDDLLTWEPETEFTTRINYVFERVMPVLDKIGVENIPLKFNRDEFVLTPEIGVLLQPVLHFMGDEVIRLHSIRTKGMFRLIERCEKVYDEQIRRRGFLTFEDALFALQHRKLGMSSADSRASDKMAIDYRLDGKLDHWLLDEFQDTSTLQWQVLSNLIDEVIQDTEKRRTFFYVGDVKQAIYGWRGGNAALFDRILQQYNQSKPPTIECQPLDKSYRSSRPVIDTVNEVFGKLSPRLDEKTCKAWQALWHKQDCEKAKVPSSGYAAFIEQPKKRDDDFTASEARYLAAAAIVASIDPIHRGLTAAILCRSNDAVTEVAAVMRRTYPDIPVALEGASRIADNPVVCLLLSLLQWAEHPGDMFAWRHLQMSPLTGLDRGEYKSIQSSIQQKGFYSTLLIWSDKLKAAAGLSDYETMRVGQLLEFSARLDQDVSREIDRFVEQVREATVEDASSKQAVRVMTIHKSKGLDFDVVVLPDLQGGGGGRGGPMIQWSEDRTMPEWILQYVKKSLVDLDDRLQACVHDQELREEIEDLCVLYVSMTRAAHALYMVTTDQGDESKAGNHAAYMKDALTKVGQAPGELIMSGTSIEGSVLYQAGKSDWYESIAIKTKPELVEDEKSEVKLAFSITAEDRAIPSSGAEFERDAGNVFASNMREGRDLGSAIHAVFEKIEWLDDGDDVRKFIPANASREVSEHAEKSFREPAIIGIFKKLPGNYSVWREQPFELMLDGKWISGVFDRIVIYRNAESLVERAEIIDYKTNRIHQSDKLQELAEHYRSQMTTYRKVVSKIMRLPEDKIDVKLIFTDAGVVVDLTR